MSRNIGRFSLFIVCKSYSLTSFMLINSPSFPYLGIKWQTHVDTTNKEIMLFNAQQELGVDQWRYTNFSVLYSIATNSFQIKTPTPESMSGNGAECSVSVHNVMYFNHQDKMEIGTYNIITEEWVLPMNPSIPIKVRSACLTSDDTYVYVIGGNDGNSNDNFQIFDIQNNKWLPSTPKLNTGRTICASQAYDGYIYVFGGWYDGWYDIDSIERIYVGSDSYVPAILETAQLELLSPRLTGNIHGIASVICNNVNQEVIYLIGGKNAEGVDSTSIEAFNITDQSISTLSVTLNEARYAPSVSCIDEYIYVFGSQTINTWEISNALYTSNSRVSITPSSAPIIYTSVSPSNIPSYQPIISTQLPSDDPSVIQNHIDSTVNDLFFHTDTDEIIGNIQSTVDITTTASNTQLLDQPQNNHLLRIVLIGACVSVLGLLMILVFLCIRVYVKKRKVNIVAAVGCKETANQSKRDTVPATFGLNTMDVTTNNVLSSLDAQKRISTDETEGVTKEIRMIYNDNLGENDDLDVVNPNDNATRGYIDNYAGQQNIAPDEFVIEDDGPMHVTPDVSGLYEVRGEGEHDADNNVCEGVCRDCGQMATGRIYGDDGLFYCMECWKYYEPKTTINRQTTKY